MNKIEKFISSHSGLIKIILIFLLIPSILFFLKSLTLNNYPDFAVYYGSKVFLEGVNPYKITFNSVYFVYPPTVILLFLPLTIPPLFVAQKIFAILSMLCFLTGILLLFKIFKVSIFSNLGLFIWILILNFFPEKFTLGMGQLNNIMFLGLCGFSYFYVKKKDFLSGIFLTIPIIIKLFPILVVIYLIFNKRWKVIFSLLVSVLIISFFVFLTIDPKINIYFIQKILPDLLGGIKTDYYNQAISGFLARYITDLNVANNIKFIVAASLSIFTLFTVNKIKNIKKYDLLNIGILITLSLMINAYSWQHHFVFLLIPYFFTFFYIKNNKLNFKYYLLLGISYILVALNLSNPLNFPSLIQYHVLYGTMLLYFIELYILMKIRFNKLFSHTCY